jgi:hypothetical protein
MAGSERPRDDARGRGVGAALLLASALACASEDEQGGQGVSTAGTAGSSGGSGGASSGAGGTGGTGATGGGHAGEASDSGTGGSSGAGGENDAGNDASSGGEAGASACGELGASCISLCSGGLACELGVCIPENRPLCGGFGQAECPPLYTACVFWAGADVGPCFTNAELDCVCATAAGQESLPGCATRDR